MNGDSAAPVIGAARAFGAGGFDLDRAVDAAGPAGAGGRRRTRAGLVPATARAGRLPAPGLRAEHDTRSGGGRSRTAPPPPWSTPSTTSRSRASPRRRGAPALAREFRQRSGSWRSLLDPDRGLLLPRDADGAFPGPDYDPASCCNGFQEGNALQYTWMVPQDMAGLLASLGSPTEVGRRLDDFHAQLNAGAGRPHAWLGNQVSFATPWADLWLGRPARARTRSPGPVASSGRWARTAWSATRTSARSRRGTSWPPSASTR